VLSGGREASTEVERSTKRTQVALRREVRAMLAGMKGFRSFDFDTP